MMNKEDTTVECNPYTHTPARLDGEERQKSVIAPAANRADDKP